MLEVSCRENTWIKIFLSKHCHVSGSLLRYLLIMISTNYTLYMFGLDEIPGAARAQENRTPCGLYSQRIRGLVGTTFEPSSICLVKESDGGKWMWMGNIFGGF